MITEQHLITSFHSFILDYDEWLNLTPAALAFDTIESKIQKSETAKVNERGRTKTVQSWIPKNQRPGFLFGEWQTSPLWQNVKLSDGDDFHMPIKDLVNGEISNRCKVYEISNSLYEKFNKGSVYPKTTPAEKKGAYKLAIPLSKEAKVRLSKTQNYENGFPEDWTFEAPDLTDEKIVAVPITIVKIRAYHFSTNRVICQFSFQISNPGSLEIDTDILAELNDTAGRFAQLVWIKHPPGILLKENKNLKPKLSSEQSFTIGQFVARMIFGSLAETRDTFRTHTHTYAQITASKNQIDSQKLETLLRRLSRQYTTDYSLRSENRICETVYDFDNVLHGICREGSATIVCPDFSGKTVSYLSNYLTETILRNYLPIIILNIHYLARVMELMAKASQIPALENYQDEDRLDDAAIKWTELHHQAVSLNIRFRFEQISQITMQNNYNKAIRAAFDLEALEKRISEDCFQMSSAIQTRAALIRDERDAKKQEKDKWIRNLISWAVPIITIAEVTNLFLELQKNTSDTGLLSGAVSDRETMMTLPISAIVLLGLLAAFWYLNRQK